MDQIQIGRFIAEQRKSLGLTQQALADTLGVSNRTISKWECGAGFPDMEHLLPMCCALSITADELLRGNKASEKASVQERSSSVLELIMNVAEEMEKEFDSHCEQCGKAYSRGKAEWAYDRHYRGWLTYSDRIRMPLCAECAIEETEKAFSEADARILLSRKPAACGNCKEHYPYCVTGCSVMGYPSL